MSGTSGTALRWTASELPDLTGAHVVITGANSGIGRELTRAFAEHGARVVLACRDIRRGEALASGLRDATVAELDLASIASIREFADGVGDSVDLLINNAGVMAPPRLLRTAEGFELQFGTNHLGHYVLTGLLLPRLLAAPAARVVTVSSIAHHGGRADVVDGNEGAYHARLAYSNSKLANLLFADELDRQSRARNVPLTSAAAHPGVAATGLAVDRQGLGAHVAVRVLGPPLLHAFSASARAASRSVLFAAVEAPPGSYTGPQRFGETRGPIGPARRSALARDAALAHRLWSVSESLTGLRYPWPAASPA